MKRIDLIQNKKMKKPLKEYYSAYYNGEFFRDFRYIYDGLKLKDNRTICFDGQIKYNAVMNAKKLGRNTDGKSRQLNFMTKADHMGHLGLLGGEISYFKTLDAYKTGDIYERYSDRQFYDIDIESDEVDGIKSDIKGALLQFKEGE